MGDKSGNLGVDRRALMGAAAVGAAALAQSPNAKAAAKAFWPNGARLAIALSMVVETGADPASVTKGPDGKAYPDLYAATGAQYASKEGIPRMLDMFDRRKLKVTAMICGTSCEAYPALAKEIAQRGHEMGAHGYQHDVQYNMDRDTERTFIQNARDSIEKATGQRPVGWNGRGQLRSANTLELAQEAGFIYHIDDVSRDEPFVAPVNGKPFAVVPYTNHLNDFSYFNNHGVGPGFAAELKYEFDALYAEGATRRRMMVVTMHDALSRASRVHAFEEFAAYAQKHTGVWFAKGADLAKWALESPDSIKEAKMT